MAGCGIVAVPQTAADQEYAQEIADKVAAYVWDKRHEFHYTGLTAAPDKALEMALAFEGKPAFITDSGDNVTSGAQGWNTYILWQVLAVEKLNKKFLFADIHDDDACYKLSALENGAETELRLGVERDEMSRSVFLNVKIKCRGKLDGFMFRKNGSYGEAIVVSVQGAPIDIVVANSKQAMVELHQFRGVGVSVDDYDVVAVKQGYIFPELKEAGKFCVMSLTNGATPQDTRIIPFKKRSCAPCSPSTTFEKIQRLFCRERNTI